MAFFIEERMPEYHIRSPGNAARLLHPSGELGFVELVVLVDVEVAHVLLLGLRRAGRDAATRRGRRPP